MSKKQAGGSLLRSAFLVVLLPAFGLLAAWTSAAHDTFKQNPHSPAPFASVASPVSEAVVDAEAETAAADAPPPALTVAMQTATIAAPKAESATKVSLLAPVEATTTEDALCQTQMVHLTATLRITTALATIACPPSQTMAASPPAGLLSPTNPLSAIVSPLSVIALSPLTLPTMRVPTVEPPIYAQGLLGARAQAAIAGQQFLFAARANGITTSINFIREGNREPGAIVLPGQTITQSRANAVGRPVFVDRMMQYFNSVHFSVTGKMGAEVAAGNAGISVRVPGAQGTLWTLMYQAPQPLYLSEAGGYTVAQNQAGATVNFVHRLFRNSVTYISISIIIPWTCYPSHCYRRAKERTYPGTGFTHHLGAEYAAFVVHHVSVFHGGSIAPASHFSQSLAPVIYDIPAGAAFGYMKRVDDYGLLYNHAAGLLAVDFASRLATLNLSLSAAANSSTLANPLFSYELRDFEMSLSADGRTFSNLHCPSAGGTSTVGCGGRTFGQGLPGMINTVGARSTLKVHGAFYGGKAQEFALGVEMAMHRTEGGSGVYIGALGRKTERQMLFAARADGSAANLIRHRSGEPLAILLQEGSVALHDNALSGQASVDSMLLYFNGLHFSRSGKRGGELAVGDWGISVRVPTVQNTMWTLMYQAPQPLHLSEAGGYTVAQNQASVTLGYVHRLFSSSASFRRGTLTVFGTVLTRYLGSEYAVFAVHSGRSTKVIRVPHATVFHGGALAPASHFAQSLAPAVYAIPAGAAFGHMKYGIIYAHVYNHEAGALAVDFASQLARLNLTLSVAANSRTWKRLLLAYELRDFHLSLSADKRTFGNLHCRSAGGRSATGCGGEVFANGIYNTTVNNSYEITARNSVAAINGTLKVHGGFYGGRAQEFALGVEHLLDGNNGIFIGALGRKKMVRTLFAAHAADVTSAIKFTGHNSRALVAILLPKSTIALYGDELSGEATVDLMMAHFNSVHFSVTGKSSAELAVGGAGISVRVPGAQGTVWTLMYQAPQPMHLDEAGGYTVAQNQASVTVNYVHRLFSNAAFYSYEKIVGTLPCGSSNCVARGHATYPGTVFTHHLGGEHAAFAVHYGETYVDSPKDLRASVFHGGDLAPASYFGQSLAPVIYAIPAGAAVGYMKRGRDYGLIYNHGAGVLLVDFAGQLAQLNLLLSAAASAGTDSSLLFSYELRDFQMSLSADKRTFGNLHCRSAGGTMTAGCGGDAFAPALSATVKNRVASPGSLLKVHGGFYGGKAQEFALGLEYSLDNGGSGVFLGALGRKGVSPQTVFAAHATATSSIRFARHSRDNLMAILLPNNTIILQGRALSGHVTADVMMAHFNSVHFSITGKSNAELAVGDAGISVRVPGAQGTLWTLMYEAPQPLYLNEAGYTVAQNQAGVTVNYVHRLFSNATVYTYAERVSTFPCGNRTCVLHSHVEYYGKVFTHHLGGEHAAFAVHYGKPVVSRYPHDLQATAYHGGALAPASYFAQPLAPAVYAIPARAAVGYMKRDENYGLIYNHEAGALAVDFASNLARLHLTLSMAANSSTLSPLLFSYGLRDFQLSLSADKRTFSNFHCPIAGGTTTENCGGEAFSEALQVTVANSAEIAGHSNNKLNVHGGFYGDKAQEFALGVEMEIRGRREWRDAAGVLLGALGRKTERQMLFAARADGSAANLSRHRSGEPLAILLQEGSIALRDNALSGQASVDSMLLYFNLLHFSRSGKRGGELAVGDWGISVRVPTVQNTMWTLMYQAPQPLHLSEAGGYTVAQNQASVTLGYVHRLFSSSASFRRGTLTVFGTVLTRYLGSEYAVFAVHSGRSTKVIRVPHATVFHGGALAPASHFAQSLAPAVYAIPAGAAFGHMKYGIIYAHVYNHEAGALAVDFASQLARLNLTLSVAANSRTRKRLLLAYELRDFQLSLSAGKRTFGNLHCRSAGGRSAAGCGGEVFANGIYNTTVNNSYEITARNSVAAINGTLKVHGAFYGGRAQEFALGVEHLLDDTNGIFIGALGRKQQGGSGGAGGASGSSAPAGVVAIFADGSTVWLTADYRAFARAEYAAFAVLAISGVQQMAHLGTRTPASFFPSLTHQAVYRIDAGQAGGWHTSAGGARLSLGNTGSADQLRVDFAADTAALDVSFQDASGVHGYVLQGVDLRLQAEGNGFQLCGVCTGTVTGSGALSGFDSVQGLQVDGAFYGDRAQEAAGVLRHRIGSSGESLDLGFVGTAARLR